MFKIILAVFVLALAATGCGKKDPKIYASDGPAAPGDMLIDSSIADARHLNPPLIDEVGGIDIAALVFDGLLRYNEKLELVPSLAEKWKVTSGGRVITYFLRKGVKFHDGVELTSQDVLFTYKTYSDPAVNTPEGANYQDIKEVEILDSYTVRVTYKKIFAPALSLTFQFILPKHLLEGKDINKDPFDRHPVGTGPYKFVEWKSDQKIVLEANPDHWRGAPKIKRFVMRVIPDESTAFLELLNGGVDALGAWTHGSSLTPLQYSRQIGVPKFTDHYNAYLADDMAYTYIGWNQRNPLFKDKKVRQALTMAIDRGAVMENVLYGLGTIATGPYALHSWANNPAVKPWPYDPVKAKDILKKAGWKAGKDGILRKTINGKDTRFKFTLITNQGNSNREKIATIVQEQLKGLGIQVDIQILEWTNFLSQHVNKRTFDAVVLGWTVTPDPDSYQVFHSSQAKEEFQFNIVNYKSYEVDRLLASGRTTMDQKGREKIYRRIHSILHEDQPFTFLHVPKVLPAIHKRFKGYKPLALWDPILLNVEEWYVPKNQQKYKP